MPYSPAQAEAYAETIRAIYAEAETRLLAAVAKRAARGIDTDGWAEKRLREVRALLAEAQQEMGQLSLFDPAVAEAIEQAGDMGAAAAVRDLRDVIGAPLTDIDAELSQAGQLAVRSLTRQTVVNLQNGRLMILRRVQDAYRDVVQRAAGQTLAGAVTRRQAAQVALDDFANRGITGFVDRAGRSWDMASYAEMATRSATGQAAVTGHADRLEGNGYDLVIVSDSPEECDICRAWEGKILSLTGRTPGYPTMAEAKAAGLFHPNCTHTFGVYIEGETRVPRGMNDADRYEIKQQQRAN
ncbi:MAG: phage minor capsid protein, partial [Rhodospirillaceae bacterium]